MAMTEEERFRFDLTGFLVRPAILAADEIAAIVEQLDRVHHDPESLKPAERAVPGGASQILLDHPKVVDVLHEIIGPEIRMEAAYSIWREKGVAHGGGMHGGGPMLTDPVFGYRAQNGKIQSGLTRVVFELGPIGKEDGGTHFLVGSHKASFPVHPDHMSIAPGERSPFLMSYECPAGSAIFFTENIAHVGPPWQRDDPRIAVLFAYNHVALNYHRLRIPPEVIESLPRERQAYFRDVWHYDFGDQRRANTMDEFLARSDAPMDPAI